ncbi:MAG: hypothetical protein GY715_16295 [Planctomycetes bacterium]|nr:hypothetical protein [Planctomycetota bacterium]
MKALYVNGQSNRGGTSANGGHILTSLPSKFMLEIACPGLNDVVVDIHLPGVVLEANVDVTLDETGMIALTVRSVGPNLGTFALGETEPGLYVPTEGPVCDGSETPEGEPACFPNYLDDFNGGLNSTPPVYSPIACGDTVCGESGNYIDGGLNSRDTDWWLVTVADDDTDVTWTVTAAGWGHAITTVDISVPGGAIVGAFLESVAGETLSVTNCLATGDWALFVSTSAFTGVACGSEYQGVLTCGECVAPPTGACCNSDGSCSDGVLDADCAAAGGLAWFENDFCVLVLCPEPPEVCGPGAGDCFVNNGTPGCEDIECCEAVCAVDPFCCETTWDGICAGQAADICGFAGEAACCFDDGSCQDLIGEACTEAGGIGQGPGTSCASFTCPQPPGPNDDCDGALPVGDLPTTISGTTVGQGPDVAPFCVTGDGAGGGVWFTVIGTGNTMTVTTCENQGVGGSADFDTKIRVYCQGCDVLACVIGNDDESGCSFHSTAIFCSQEGSEYHILVHGFSSSEGNFTLAVVDDGTPCSGAFECIPPTPEGACCFQTGPCDGECVDALTQEDCEAQGGVYQGDDSSCLGGFEGYAVEDCTNAYASIANLPGAILAPNASSSDDDGDLVDIGFTFPFHLSGSTHDTVSIASNGYLTFGLDVSDFSNDPIPSTIDPNDFITALWDDWSPNLAGDVYYGTFSDPLRFMASWEGMSPFGGGDPTDFQVVMWPDGTIELRRGAQDAGTAATCGIENSDGTDGIATSCDPDSCTRIVATFGDPIVCVPPDITPPDLTCIADEVTGGANSSGDSSGSSGSSSSTMCFNPNLILGWEASDLCGDVMVTATLDIGCMVLDIENGQEIKLLCHNAGGGSGSSGAGICGVTYCHTGEVAKIKSNMAIYTVTAVDEAGNVSTCELDLCPPPPHGSSSSSSSSSSSESGASGWSSSDDSGNSWDGLVQ